jgi:hypothetical protein
MLTYASTHTYHQHARTCQMFTTHALTRTHTRTQTQTQLRNRWLPHKVATQTRIHANKPNAQDGLHQDHIHARKQTNMQHTHTYACTRARTHAHTHTHTLDRSAATAVTACLIPRAILPPCTTCTSSGTILSGPSPMRTALVSKIKNLELISSTSA